MKEVALRCGICGIEERDRTRLHAVSLDGRQNLGSLSTIDAGQARPTRAYRLLCVSCAPDERLPRRA